MFESEDNLTLQRLAGVGLGFAIMGTLAVEDVESNTVVVPFAADARPHRRIGLVWHHDRYRSPASIGFVDVATEAIASWSH